MMTTKNRIKNLKANEKLVNWLQCGIKRCHKTCHKTLQGEKGIYVKIESELKIKTELHVYKHCINVLTRDHDLVKDLQFYLYGGINLFYKSNDISEFEIDLTWEVINFTLNHIKLITSTP